MPPGLRAVTSELRGNYTRPTFWPGQDRGEFRRFHRLHSQRDREGERLGRDPRTNRTDQIRQRSRRDSTKTALTDRSDGGGAMIIFVSCVVL